MKITKQAVARMIQDTLIKNRDKSINAVRLSDIIIDDNISQRDLFKIVMNQLEEGNDKLIFNFGYVIDDTFDMRDFNPEKFSGIDNFSLSASQLAAINSATDSSVNEADYVNAPPKDTWWSQNKGDVLTTGLTAGVSILGGLFGGNKSDTPYVAPSPLGGGNNSAMIAMMNAQNISASNAANKRAAEESARRSSNMIIFGVIGSVVLIGGITAIVLTRN